MILIATAGIKDVVIVMETLGVILYALSHGRLLLQCIAMAVTRLIVHFVDSTTRLWGLGHV